MLGRYVETGDPMAGMTLHSLVVGAAKLGVTLSIRQQEQVQAHYRELVGWNRRVNLTAVTEWEEAQTRHFLDSLTVMLAFPHGLGRSTRLLDVGSGGGFPGVPLKVACPGLRVALLDSVARKTAFLSHLCSVLGLEDVEVYTGRAEELARTSLREAFDGVVSRGLAPMNVLAELTLPFCRVGGITVAMKQEGVAEEVAGAQAAIAQLGGQLQEIVRVQLEELGERRTLVVVKKVAPTPEKYPRRPGIPAKRPL